MTGELRTVGADGTVTVAPLTYESARPLLASWAAQQDAWEDHCLQRLGLRIEHVMASVPTNWDTIAFLAEHPSNLYLTQWGWWDA